jgi:biopolymer transport protein ExbD/biopolymer transport protein TolR
VGPDINVTPLVDVVLVLLIIFMVVAPRMDQDVPVDLPGIFNPDPEVETAMDPVKLSVATAGEYYINDQRLDLEAAVAVLAAEHAVEPMRRLVLRADAKLTYGQVREILSRSQQVGFPGMSLMVGERHRMEGTHDAAAEAQPGGATAAADAAPDKEG